MLDVGAIPLAEGAPAWSLVVVAILGLLGGVIAALIGPWSEGIARRDQLKSYKRNVYRNFLDHGYWYLHPEGDSKDQNERAVLYVADWHRIQLITDDESVERLTRDIKEPKLFSEEVATELLAAFKAEIGSRGLKEKELEG